MAYTIFKRRVALVARHTFASISVENLQSGLFPLFYGIKLSSIIPSLNTSILLFAVASLNNIADNKIFTHLIFSSNILLEVTGKLLRYQMSTFLTGRTSLTTNKRKNDGSFF